MISILVYYYFIKIIFFFALVKVLVRFEPMQKHTLFLAVLYTAAVAFLSFVFLLSWQKGIQWQGWQLRLAGTIGVTRTPMNMWGLWLSQTFLLALVYFRLIVRFDEGVVFWTLLLLGCLVALY